MDTINLVAEKFELDPEDIKGKCRRDDICTARQVVMYILWMTNEFNSMSSIGRSLGRTPATVSHGIQKICRLMSRDALFKSKVENILLKSLTNT